MISKKFSQRQISSLPLLPILAHSFTQEKQTQLIFNPKALKRKKDNSLLSHRSSAHDGQSISEITQKLRKNSMQKDNRTSSLSQSSLPPILFSKPDDIDKGSNKHPFRNLIFSPVISEMVLKKHLLMIQKGLQYSKRHLKGPSENLLKSMQVTVYRDRKSKTKSLFLDLDETLIHSCSIYEHPDALVDAVDDLGLHQKIPIKIRPHCLEFIKTTSQYYDIYIFTASSMNYASGIVYYLDPEAIYIKGFYCRNYCMETKNGLYIKDLRIFANLNIQDIILVDNLSHSFGTQLFNGIPILEWRSDKSDQELVYLAHYLKDASRAADVREYNKQQLKLNELINFNIEQ